MVCQFCQGELASMPRDGWFILINLACWVFCFPVAILMFLIPKRLYCSRCGRIA